MTKKKDWLFILTVFAFWRGYLLAAEVVGRAVVPFKYSFPYTDTVLIKSGLPDWLWAWGNFDGVHYLTLAKIGYDGFGTQVFFPLYPMLINILTRLIPNLLISGLLISHLAAILAALVLYRVTKNKWAVLFLFAFPTSFFWGSVYTESLFLLLVLLTFFRSKLFSFLAGATRLIGVFLWPWGWLGAVLYSGYLWWRFGRPLFFLSAQSAFGGSRADTLTKIVNPLQVLARYARIFLTVNPGHYDFWVAVGEVTAFLFGVGILFWITTKKRYPVSWLVFSWGALLLPSFSGTLSSLPRYLLPIFPIFLGLAEIKSQTFKFIIFIIFIVLLGLATALFTRGYWVA